MRALFVFFISLFLLASTTARAVDENDLLPIDQAFAVSAEESAADRIQIVWDIAPGYYLYRERMSAKAVDTSIASQPLELPEGAHKNDPFFGDVQTFRGKVTGLLSLDTPKPNQRIAIELKYQGCADIGVCYPPHKKIIEVMLGESVTGPAIGPAPLPASAGAAFGAINNSVIGSQDALPIDQAFKIEAIINGPNELLVRMTPTQGYYLYRDKTQFVVEGSSSITLGTPRWPTAKPYKDEHFGDVQVYFDQAEIPVPVQRSSKDKQSFILAVNYLGCKDQGICYPPAVKRFDLSLTEGGETSSAASTVNNSSGFLAAFLAALLGGLILNLMPCVLPVLSLKALSLASSGESHSKMRKHALWYTAGVLISFLVFAAIVLGVREGGQALGWGFQLQQPWLIGSLMLLMVAIGLNLSGVFEFGTSITNMGQSLTQHSGARGDFFTGVLAVVVASPCTAPFMASGLAYAFTAPVLNALLVFVALGIGLALPFLLIAFIPALARLLPKPGAWMQNFKQWLALPMYLTAVWLLWVFNNQVGSDATAVLLVGTVLLAMGLWWWQHAQLKSGLFNKTLALLLISAAVISVPYALKTFARSPQSTVSEEFVKYSPEALNQYRSEGRVVFVDMTADWCITCKVNEKAVLHTDKFKAEMKKYNAVYMVGDYTNQDEVITAFLNEHKAVGVPLYVMYPADGGAGEKLPQLLTDNIMSKALERAAN
jgi:thiol:disulfide interchange protein